MRPKIVGFMVVGKGEAKRYLKASLDEFKRLCDDAVIVLNDTDPETEALVASYGYWKYRDDRVWGNDQPLIKTDLLKRIGKLKPDWVLPLDADEVFDSAFDRAALEELASKKAMAYYFYIVNLWNDPEHYWRAASFWNIRLFRFAPEHGLDFIRKNVHCGLAPPFAYHYGRYAPFHVKHFGLMAEGDRKKKVERYAKYDPRGDKVGIAAYYDALKATHGGVGYDEAELRKRVADEVAGMKQADKSFSHMASKSNRFAIVRRLKDGRELDIPYDHLERTIQAGKFEFIREISITAGPVASAAVEADALECPLCGFVAADEADLGGHKASHDAPAPVSVSVPPKKRIGRPKKVTTAALTSNGIEQRPLRS